MSRFKIYTTTREEYEAAIEKLIEASCEVRHDAVKVSRQESRVTNCNLKLLDEALKEVENSIYRPDINWNRNS